MCVFQEKFLSDILASFIKPKISPSFGQNLLLTFFLYFKSLTLQHTSVKYSNMHMVLPVQVWALHND